MFGQDDNNAQNDDITAVNPTLTSTDASTPADDTVTDTSLASGTTVSPTTTPTVEPSEDLTPTATPPVETPEEPTEPEVTDIVPSVSDSTSSVDDADLLSLKKQTLEELSPLLDKLDQTPEEKFKTTMMMIQATDSSHLIKNAHEAALAITDEKVRAQALLDIVNEINYFTQQDQDK